jgi:phospholipid N-methyltransferase
MRKDIVEFIKAGLQKPLEVSTIVPTSSALAHRMLAELQIHDGLVVELGTGTGAITRHLVQKITDPQRYLGFEINDEMTQFMREHYPQLKFAQAAADQVLQFTPPGSVDSVISSLPWTVFSIKTQTTTLNAIFEALRPGGIFITYVCLNAAISPLARSFVHQLRATFATVKKSPIEWRNFPPAFVYFARKAEAR